MKKFIILGSVALIGLFLLLAVSTYWFIFGLDNWLYLRDLQRPVDQRLLFIGNSFTYQNDIDTMVGNLMEEQSGSRIFSTRVAFGGYRLFDHLDDIVDKDLKSPIRQLLIDGADDIRDWDLVVLQEQVETPGLSSYEQEKAASLDSARMLGNLASNNGARVMLLETWASSLDPDDPDNPFPEFTIMQQQLTEANDDIAAALATNGIEATIAPAGQAFLLVYNESAQNGADPLAEDSKFLQLYSEDRRHASLAGSYLAAAVVVANYTQLPVSDAAWVPLGLDADVAQYLRDIADETVFK